MARHLAARHAPDGPDHLTAVPTVLSSGDALNVVPAAGELICDVRADGLAPIEALIASVPAEHEGVELTTETLRLWPGMHTGRHGRARAGGGGHGPGPPGGARARAAGPATPATWPPPCR